MHETTLQRAARGRSATYLSLATETDLWMMGMTSSIGLMFGVVSLLAFWPNTASYGVILIDPWWVVFIVSECMYKNNFTHIETHSVYTHILHIILPKGTMHTVYYYHYTYCTIHNLQKFIPNSEKYFLLIITSLSLHSPLYYVCMYEPAAFVQPVTTVSP